MANWTLAVILQVVANGAIQKVSTWNIHDLTMAFLAADTHNNFSEPSVLLYNVLNGV
jgi:hypothetical protein